ncbi:MAG: YHS domain-containing protein [Nitrospiraceae bacterium]|nr:MAG: YHS domain-containing protein [Nitrospiraceae bacterium]
MKQTTPSFFILCLAVLIASCTSSNLPPVNADREGIAIKGYDAVAYFTEGRPVPGDRGFSHEWNGARWLFASKENRDLFMKDPGAYAPQYGGY